MKNQILFSIFYCLIAFISTSALAAGPSKEPLFLECSLVGRSDGYGYMSPMYMAINETLSVKIADGRLVTQSSGRSFTFDAPVSVTSEEYTVVINGYNSEGTIYYESNLSINRNSGTIRAYKKGTSNDGKIILNQASGSCSKISNKQKF